MKVACVNCGQPYPESGVPYKCPNCSGLFDYVEPFALNSQPATLNQLVSLGEGNTPLLSAKVFGREVYLRRVSLNVGYWGKIGVGDASIWKIKNIMCWFGKRLKRILNFILNQTSGHGLEALLPVLQRGFIQQSFSMFGVEAKCIL